jgi:hypothetical protein
MLPRSIARMAGVADLLEGAASAYGQVIVPGALIVAGSAAATAANVMGNERLVWLGLASSLAGVGFHIVWALLMYELLKPVSGLLSRLAAFVILVGCAVQTVTALLYIAPFPARRQRIKRLYARAAAGIRVRVFQAQRPRVRHLPHLLRALVRADRNPDFQVNLPAAHSRRAVDDRRPGLDALPRAAARAASLHVYRRRLGLAEIPLQLWLIVMAVNASRWAEAARAPRA